MLSEQSYLTAIAVYLGAAGLLLLYLAWWLGRSWRPAWASLAVLLVAALMLTPAYPREGVETLAPALVVACFQLLTEGVEAAEHALRPLAMACGIAVVLTVILRLTVFRRPRRTAPATGSGGDQS